MKRIKSVIIILAMVFVIISFAPSAEIFASEPHYYATALQESINNSTGNTNAVLYDLDGCGGYEMIVVDEGITDEENPHWASYRPGNKIMIFDNKFEDTPTTVNFSITMGCSIYITNENYFVVAEAFEGAYWGIYKYKDGLMVLEAEFSDSSYNIVGPFLINGIEYSESEFNSALDGYGLSDYYDLDIAAVIWEGSVNSVNTPPTDDTNRILAMTSAPTASSTQSSAAPTQSTVLFNGTQKNLEAYLIDGSNYFKLRDLAMAVSRTNKQFDVGYNETSKAVTLTSGRPYTIVGGELTARDGSTKTYTTNQMILYIDGQRIEMTSYLIDGNNFLKLRDVLQLFDIGVTYDEVTRNIGIETSIGYNE